MTHQEQFNALDSIVELLAEQGFEGMAQAIEILFNEAMKLQRAEALGALPYQRTADRRGHAHRRKLWACHPIAQTASSPVALEGAQTTRRLRANLDAQAIPGSIHVCDVR